MNTATAVPLERACWAGASLLALTLLQSVYRVPLGMLPLAVATGLLLFAAFRPWPALLVTAATGPFASMLFQSAGATYDVRFEEVAALAFIAGAAMHHAVRSARAELPSLLRWTSWLLVLTTLASALVVLAGIGAAEPEVGSTGYAWRFAATQYLQGSSPLSQAMLFVESVLLCLICAELCAQAPRRRVTAVAAALVGSAAVAGVWTIQRLVTVALDRSDPWGAIVTLLAQFRLSVVQPDLNAAGSYFAMLVCVAWGLMRWNRATAIAIPLILLPLWMSGSRAAILVVAIAGIVAAMSARIRSSRTLAASLASVLVFVGMISVYPAARNENIGSAALFRIQLAKAAAYAFADAPVFGIGAGQFYDQSMRYVAASRPSDTPLQVSASENAHNNFLQVGAELGAIGLGLLLLLLASALSRPEQPLIHPRLEWPLATGLMIYLFTCLVGHPWLVATAAFPFWLLLGASASGRGGAPLPSRGWRHAASVVVLLVVASVPLRALHAIRSADLEHAGTGVSAWQRDEQGVRFRWAGARSSIYVPSNARVVRIALRHGGRGPEVLEVRIFLEGREANRILLRSGTGWNAVRLLVAQGYDSRFLRVELLVTDPRTGRPLDLNYTDDAGALMIGRVEPEGTRD